MDLSALQYDVAHKLKKLKPTKTDSPNPIAEAAIQAAKASSALQNFQSPNAGGSSSGGGDKRKKDTKKVTILLDSLTRVILTGEVTNNIIILFVL